MISGKISSRPKPVLPSPGIMASKENYPHSWPQDSGWWNIIICPYIYIYIICQYNCPDININIVTTWKRLTFLCDLWCLIFVFSVMTVTLDISVNVGLASCLLMIFPIDSWLVIWNHGILNDFPSIGNGIIIPTDELTPSFFRGVGGEKPPTRKIHFQDLSGRSSRCCTGISDPVSVCLIRSLLSSQSGNQGSWMPLILCSMTLIYDVNPANMRNPGGHCDHWGPTYRK